MPPVMCASQRGRMSISARNRPRLCPSATLARCGPRLGLRRLLFDYYEPCKTCGTLACARITARAETVLRCRSARECPAIRWGASVRWTLAASGLLGVRITASPALLGASGAAANNGAVAGLLVLTVAVCTSLEVIRPMRFVNRLAAGWR